MKETKSLIAIMRHKYFVLDLRVRINVLKMIPAKNLSQIVMAKNVPEYVPKIVKMTQ